MSKNGNDYINTLLKKTFRLIFIFIILSIAVDVAASDEELQKGFANHLFEKKDYFRAITEAERLIFYYPNSPFLEEMKILIADSYSSGGDEEKALQHYLNFINEYPESSNIPEIYFKLGKLYSKNRDFISAIKFFEDIIHNEKSSESIIIKAKKWIILLSLLRDLDDTHINNLVSKYGFPKDKEITNMLEDYKSLNFKSPQTAGVLSALVPGAGQLYLDRKRDAAAAFILNSIFIWGIVESFKRDNTSVGILLSIFELGWYGGNIYSAINGAYKHNSKIKESFRNKFSIGLNINVSKNYESPSSIIFAIKCRY